jgi:hypothetical protein
MRPARRNRVAAEALNAFILVLPEFEGFFVFRLRSGLSIPNRFRGKNFRGASLKDQHYEKLPLRARFRRLPFGRWRASHHD